MENLGLPYTATIAIAITITVATTVQDPHNTTYVFLEKTNKYQATYY